MKLTATMGDLQKKIDFAIKLLRAIPRDKEIELSYSGGKDSDVILELAKMAGIPYRAIYKNTTIDPPGTVQHCKENGVEIVYPQKSFFEIIRQKGAPSRHFRFCCSELKEYKICDRAIQGIRRAESKAREERYQEPEICRIYNKRKKDPVQVYLPILEWTDEDVEEFIYQRQIKCHPLYYDSDGTFNVKRRVGCIGCPLAYKDGLFDFIKYPKMLRLWIRNVQIHMDSHPNCKNVANFQGSAYNLFFCRFFTNARLNGSYYSALTGSLFPELAINTKEYMENYFKTDLTI